MIEIRIHGRGGQGGVTLAKLIATTRYLLGDSVQAFGVYAAERSGAPLQAFCRCDAQPITNRNMVYAPDHVIVLDPTLVAPGISGGLRAGGSILINTADEPKAFSETFPGCALATVDATSIARRNRLGTASVPIVNTALLGAVARVLDFTLEDVDAALEHLGFIGANVAAAHEAWDAVRMLPPAAVVPDAAAGVTPAATSPAAQPTASFVEGRARQLPRIRTGDWASRQPHRHTLVPPCNHVCPAGNDVQGFLAALARDDADAALDILLQTTPFPSVCGRVCPAPCMERCNRLQLDGAVNVRDLERLAGDRGRADVRPHVRRSETIAVVGSGPAGLTAAYHLARLGYGVTVFEGGATLGGLLRTGIPAYRLPRSVLDREVQRILDLGVETQLEARVDRRRLLELAHTYDAVLVATGLQELRTLQLVPGDGDAIMQGIDFLDRANADDTGIDDMGVDGQRVIVVGGGNTAFDAARSALRLGAHAVQIVYRRTRREMPALPEEIEQAIEEGVRIEELSLPLSLAPATRGFRLTCRRLELGAPDESGRRRPVEVPGLDYAIPCDRVILALGQSPETSIFPEGTELHDGADLLGMLPTPVFAVGDLATNDGTVTAAIGSGRRAAFHVHRTFTGEQLLGDAHDDDDVVGAEALQMHLFERQARDDGRTRPAHRRRWSYDEVHEGVADATEARRCLSCGVCNECDRCVTYCPEGVLKRVGHEFRFDYSACKGCGVCVAECPRSVVYMSTI